jgi:hypothetical protein
MTCRRCQRPLGKRAVRCLHCGEPNPRKPGTFHTSTVLISCGRDEGVYRTVEDVPPRLRTQLLKSTSGGNSATILIADRGGRREIARTLRRLPAQAQRRLRRSLQLAEQPGGGWLTPPWRRIVLAVAALCCLAFIGLVFTHRW